jgi:hypothetical protein
MIPAPGRGFFPGRAMAAPPFPEDRPMTGNSGCSQRPFFKKSIVLSRRQSHHGAAPPRHRRLGPLLWLAGFLASTAVYFPSLNYAVRDMVVPALYIPLAAWTAWRYFSGRNLSLVLCRHGNSLDLCRSPLRLPVHCPAVRCIPVVHPGRVPLLRGDGAHPGLDRDVPARAAFPPGQPGRITVRRLSYRFFSSSLYSPA